MTYAAVIMLRKNFHTCITLQIVMMNKRGRKYLVGQWQSHSAEIEDTWFLVLTYPSMGLLTFLGGRQDSTVIGSRGCVIPLV